MDIRIKLLSPKALIPRTAPGDSGHDLYASVSVVVQPGGTVRVSTGLAIEIPIGMTGLVLPRSGLSAQGRVVITGTIDPSYRGDVGVLAHNAGKAAWHIAYGDRIAQILFVATPVVTLDPVAVLSDTARGGAGFGSTGR